MFIINFPSPKFLLSIFWFFTKLNKTKKHKIKSWLLSFHFSSPLLFVLKEDGLRLRHSDLQNRKKMLEDGASQPLHSPPSHCRIIYFTLTFYKYMYLRFVFYISIYWSVRHWKIKSLWIGGTSKVRNHFSFLELIQ